MAAAIFLVVIAGAAVAAVALSTSRASLTADSQALAKISLPLGGARIESVTAYVGRQQQPLPVTLRGKQIWPNQLVSAHQPVSIYVTVKRPSSVGWLGGGTERLSINFLTPSAHLNQHYVTLANGAPLKLQFAEPVEEFSSGQQGHLHRQVLQSAQSAISLQRTAVAGTIWVSAAPRSWETSTAALISWFPAGSKASAVAFPSAGTTIGPSTPITLTFNKTIKQALGNSMPPVSPATQGTWHEENSHTIVFKPEGWGYGIGAKVSIALPSGVTLDGGKISSGSETGNWTVPAGTTTRLQQLLANLGYLPLNFSTNGASVALTPAAQEAAAVKPPAGNFNWRYPNTPSALHNMWQVGTSGVMTQGAIMAFENDHDMTADGVAGPAVWKALFAAAIADKGSSFGYTFVQVSEGSPETESTWHSGKTVASGLVNTGIPATPTETGVYPVFEHAISVTMEGTNADGSHYDDPGVPYVSYFHGGDALHGFIRGSYGYPQSDGCVEMPYSEAASVYPYTPIGTLVDVT